MKLARSSLSNKILLLKVLPALLAFACGAVIGWTPALAQDAVQEFRVPVAQALPAGFQFLQQGQPAAAREIALALLQRNDNDIDAWILLSRAERDLGNYDQAAKAGRIAFRKAETESQKFAAATSVAQALSSDGSRTRAQLWLRRAYEHAPDDRTRALALRDFRYVQERNPLQVQFSLGLTPSDNINNGPTSNTVIIGGLEFVDASAVPLSGLRYGYSIDLGYLKETATGHRLTYGLALSDYRVALSDEALAAVPDADPENFRQSRAEVNLNWSANPNGETAGRSARLSLGREWAAGAPVSNYAGITYRQVLSSERDFFSAYSLGIEHKDRLDASIRDSDTIRLDWQWGRQLDSGNRLSGAIGLSDTRSESSAIGNSAATITTSYQMREPVLPGVTLAVSAKLGIAQYHEPFFSADNRLDHSARITLSFGFPSLSAYGFRPALDVSYDRNRSNVSLYDTKTTEVSLGLRSEF